MSIAVSTFSNIDLLKTLNLDVAIPNAFSTMRLALKSLKLKIRYANSKAL